MKINESFIKKGIQVYGKQRQSRIVIEECSELIQAICKMLRGETAERRQNLIEEIGDVYVSLKIAEAIFSLDRQDIQKVIDFKVERTLRKIEEKEDAY